MNNAGIRNWSAGSLDFPPRAGDMGGPSPRQDLMRDKQRRSVMGIMRRESAGVSATQSENWASGSARESAATLTKWDQLNLVPDLLRSLSKFGVGPPNKIQQRALPFLLKGADIIAQAPPTQERIAAYVIPAIQIVLTHINNRNANVGPTVVMISTTVDQATQAQRMIRDLGGPIGVRSALGVGVASASNDLGPELRLLQQNSPHIICGTPQKLHALFTAPGGLNGSQVRFLVLDEVDQLIARNLHDFVLNIVKGFPPPRSRSLTSIGGPGNSSSPVSQSPYTQSSSSSDSVSANLNTPLQAQVRRLSGFGSPADDSATGASSQIERQSALFSNTVPQDVLNLAQTIQLREPVRVLVRRDGNVTHADTSQGARGLRQFYLYLAFTAGGRPEPLPSAPSGGLGIIGSGRGTSSAETAQAREWKLEALADLFDDIDVHHAIIHVGGMTSLDTVVYKLASKGLEAIPLHGDMNASAKLAALNKFRGPPAVVMRQLAAKVLVVYDVQVKTTEVSQIPLIINYDLPKAVEEYAHRVAPAVATSYARAGVVVNFVTATGGDVEMLRSIECFYKIKCPEVPMSLRDII
ncbi:P-loop containing nucleoside triphosphate hydrolase protein [Punctularia strigosozonata HHB-11173 SS5]|uniref:P-loop containing nucleoside triphosphate hydrolase protein n=1 Tax=Punctularia strigosozonata (strain HHB-11173) TaxID=741275 RepID=UPI0004416CA7|nr:P-loop containing nucleoside triphosphate hydrolase protein [Punctularia strigosozonata HHB-11173 SS5]EIN10689.1 P-loop containing nucleoside triphosphate hydrolase protein [Punctularia strigosozonata HHB-11173 SS5]